MEENRNDNPSDSTNRAILCVQQMNLEQVREIVNQMKAGGGTSENIAIYLKERNVQEAIIEKLVEEAVYPGQSHLKFRVDKRRN